jgi:hypothetical protein
MKRKKLFKGVIINKMKNLMVQNSNLQRAQKKNNSVQLFLSELYLTKIKFIYILSRKNVLQFA